MSQQRPEEARRYRILDVVGEGGFGKVYRARLEGAEGFSKDVAIKLLTDHAAPEGVLQRFRDESRILGLVRDRAIVTVDPPTRLEGKWAVVMEFVDGANCERLMRAGPIPPRPAVEIVQEVARALDSVYHQPGPDGAPLHLVHRDIKPGNIQVTPSGGVKILDFGIARAEFQARESRTTTHIGGTFGYIAPERLQGEDGPAADVYSLGVVLAALLCGRRPTQKNREKILPWIEADADLKKAWDLAQRMQEPDPESRPTAREVEDLCAAVGPTLRGEALRRWAEQEVKTLPLVVEDHLLGNVLTETMANLPRFVDSAELPIHSARTVPGRRWSTVFLALVGLVLSITAVVAVAGVTGFMLARVGQSTQVARQPPPMPVVVPAPVGVPEPAAEPAPVAAPEPAVETEPVVDAEPVAVAEPVAAPAPVVAPAPIVRPSPTPIVRPPPRPPPTPSPALPTFGVSIGSVPLGLEVRVDGALVGRTPLVDHALTVGSHRVEVGSGDQRGVKTVRVGKGEPVRYIFRGGDEWSVFY